MLLRWVKSFHLEDGNQRYSTCTPDETKYLLYNNRSMIFAIAGTNNGLDLRPPDCVTELDTINLYYSGDNSYKISINSIDFNNVARIRSNTFNWCPINSSINSIDLKDVKTIDSNALNMFSGLTDVEISKNIEHIGSNVFPKEVVVSVSPSNQNFELKTIDNVICLVNIKTNTIVHINLEDVEYSLEITNIYKLSDYLFGKNGIKFSSLKIDCEVIPEYCFYNAEIKHLSLGSSVRIIKKFAFFYSKISNGDDIPRTITTMENYTFANGLKLNDNNEAWCNVVFGGNVVYSYSMNAQDFSQ